jgi:hypothetical protein
VAAAGAQATGAGATAIGTGAVIIIDAQSMG